jgi:hypothetical protein
MMLTCCCPVGIDSIEPVVQRQDLYCAGGVQQVRVVARAAAEAAPRPLALQHPPHYRLCWAQLGDSDICCSVSKEHCLRMFDVSLRRRPCSVQYRHIDNLQIVICLA